MDVKEIQYDPDPMDLGPFLQNYVLKNPFCDPLVRPGAAGGRGQSGPAAGEVRSAPVAVKSRPGVPPGASPRRKLMRRSRDSPASTPAASKQHEDARAATSKQKEPMQHLQTWLRDNYRYVPKCRRLVIATQHLLLRIQQAFPDVTSDVVDSAVLKTFPSCMRIIKRGGYFWQGLIGRPEPDVLQSPSFSAALEAVKAGVLTTRMAAEQYGIRESALMGATVWADSKQPVAVEERNGANRHDGSSDVTDEPRPAADHRPVSSRCGGPSSRKRSAVCEVNGNGTDHQADSHVDTDDSVDFEQMLQEATGSDIVVDLSPSSQQNAANSHRQSVSPDFHSEVKLEPEDELSIEDSEQELPSEQYKYSVSPAHRINKSNGVPEPGSVTNGRQESQLARLQAQLEASQEANLALQEELSTRDFHLTQLADDFCQLHQQFRKMARHFQVVIRDIQRSAPESSDSCLENAVYNGSSINS